MFGATGDDTNASILDRPASGDSSRSIKDERLTLDGVELTRDYRCQHIRWDDH